MDVGTLKERLRLLDLFRQSRERKKSDEDALEDKLFSGEGTLAEFERRMLMEAIATLPEVSDREFRRHKDVLGI